jgi:hypothetical protein
MLTVLLFSLMPAAWSACPLKRDPFYVANVVQVGRSRYDLSAPKILGVIFVDGSSGAIVQFDDRTEVVYVGDVIREHVVTLIRDDGITVRDRNKKEKRWPL